jgi:hypothetical protein
LGEAKEDALGKLKLRLKGASYRIKGTRKDPTEPGYDGGDCWI